jgi:electron transfer flavoprotein alpha subunit
MSRVLIVAEHDGQKLNSSTARCVSCARTLPEAKIAIVVFGADPAAVAAQAATLEGVTEVLTVANPANAHALAAVLAPQLASVAADYSHLFAPSTTFGVGQISDVMAVEGAYRFKRPVYAGNAIATVEAASDAKVVATVRTASFEAAGSGATAPIRALAVNVPLPMHTRFVSVKSGNTDRPDLQSAPKVVSGGRALGSAENFKLIYGLAAKMGAAVGASRAAVDAGYAPNELQVGQTGKIIAPELYVAIGISGAIQHLTGIKDARTIVAINKDGEAPIFEVADFGLVGDLFQIVPALEKLISRT